MPYQYFLYATYIPGPSASVGTGCVMDMRHPNGVRSKNVYLPRGSLLVMEGPARYKWSHGIASRKTDMVSVFVRLSRTV